MEAQAEEAGKGKAVAGAELVSVKAQLEVEATRNVALEAGKNEVSGSLLGKECWYAENVGVPHHSYRRLSTPRSSHCPVTCTCMLGCNVLYRVSQLRNSTHQSSNKVML